LTQPAPTDTYTLSLHDALPISQRDGLHDERAGAHPQRSASARFAAAGVRLFLLHVPALQPRLSASPLWGRGDARADAAVAAQCRDRKSTRLNSSHVKISYAVLC